MDVHVRIVEFLSEGYNQGKDIAERIAFLKQALELLLYHTNGNDLVDEFFEQMISLHVDSNHTIRRFAAYFIEVLCISRSVYACRCLPALLRLLDDSDLQVLYLSIRASRTVFKRALYWISVQQKDPQYGGIANENVLKLNSILSKIVKFLNSTGDEFQLSIKFVETVIMSQSFSGENPKSIAQIETAGCSSLEDLRLNDPGPLEISKLNSQSDKLVEYICAVAFESKSTKLIGDCYALVRSLSLIAFEREQYIPAIILSVEALIADLSENDGLRGFVVGELKKILASRHAVHVQPLISNILAKLSVTKKRANIDSTVFGAELTRIKARVVSKTPNRKTPAWNQSMEENNIIDEEHAVAVCAIRAQNSSELAKLALSLLSKIPSRSEEPEYSLQISGFNESQKYSGNVIDISEKSLADIELQTEFAAHETDEYANMAKAPPIPTETTPKPGKPFVFDFFLKEGLYQFSGSFPDTLSKLVAAANIHRLEPASADFLDEQLKDLISSHRFEDLCGVLSAIFSRIGFECYESLLERVFQSLPTDVSSLKDIRRLLIDHLPVLCISAIHFWRKIASSEDHSVRRPALATLGHIFISKPGSRINCLLSIFDLCHAQDGQVRDDACKTLAIKLYDPTARDLSGTLNCLRSSAIEYLCLRSISQPSEPAALKILPEISADLINSLSPHSEPRDIADNIKAAPIGYLARRNVALIAQAHDLISEVSLQRRSALFSGFCESVSFTAEIDVLTELTKIFNSPSVDPDFVRYSVKYLQNGESSEEKFHAISAAVNTLKVRGLYADILPAINFIPAQDVLEICSKLISSSSDQSVVDDLVTTVVNFGGSDIGFMASLTSETLRLGTDPAFLQNVMCALNKLFALKDKFDSLNAFQIVMRNVSEDEVLPIPFLRFVIQNLQSFPGTSSEAFIAESVLAQVVRPTSVDDSTHWRGLSMLLTLLSTSSDSFSRNKACDIISRLSSEKVSDLLNRKKELKAILREFLVQQPVGMYMDMRRQVLE